VHVTHTYIHRRTYKQRHTLSPNMASHVVVVVVIGVCVSVHAYVCVCAYVCCSTCMYVCMHVRERVSIYQYTKVSWPFITTPDSSAHNSLRTMIMMILVCVCVCVCVRALRACVRVMQDLAYDTSTHVSKHTRTYICIPEV
jgi:ABC-type uncharacterized transport system permease subunit